MKKFFITLTVIAFFFGGTSLLSGAPLIDPKGIDIFANGEYFSSLKSYKKQEEIKEQKIEEKKLQIKAKNGIGQSTEVKAPEANKPEASLDLREGKTVSLNLDGSMHVQPGVDETGQKIRHVGSEQASTKEKVIEPGPKQSKTDENVDAGKPENKIPAEPVDGGHVAGIEPSVGEIVRDFKDPEKKVGVDLKTVNSMDEIEEDLRQKLKSRGSPVLFISDKNKLKVMELKASQDISKGNDQKNDQGAGLKGEVSNENQEVEPKNERSDRDQGTVLKDQGHPGDEETAQKNKNLVNDRQVTPQGSGVHGDRGIALQDSGLDGDRGIAPKNVDGLSVFNSEAPASPDSK